MMRAITLTQPYATLVEIEAKTWETRGRNMSYRGELAIHAGKGFPLEYRHLVYREPFASALARVGIEDISQLPLGAIVCLVDITFSQKITAENAPTGDEFHFGDYTPGRSMIKVENVRRLARPVPASGCQAMPWYVPPEVEAAVREQLR